MILKNIYKKTYPQAIADIYTIPEQKILPDGSTKYEEVVVGFLLGIISQVEGEEWKNLESTLGELDHSDFFQFFA